MVFLFTSCTFFMFRSLWTTIITYNSIYCEKWFACFDTYCFFLCYFTVHFVCTEIKKRRKIQLFTFFVASWTRYYIYCFMVAFVSFFDADSSFCRWSGVEKKVEGDSAWLNTKTSLSHLLNCRNFSSKAVEYGDVEHFCRFELNVFIAEDWTVPSLKTVHPRRRVYNNGLKAMFARSNSRTLTEF